MKVFRILFMFTCLLFATGSLFGQNDTISEAISVRIIVIDSVDINRGVVHFNEGAKVLLLCELDSMSREILDCKYGKGRIILRVTDRNIVMQLKENENHKFKVIRHIERLEDYKMPPGLYRSPCGGYHLRLNDEKYYVIYELVE